MKPKHHCHIGRTGITQCAKEQVLLIPNQPINPEPIRHTQPIKMEYFGKDKKKKSKYQRS